MEHPPARTPYDSGDPPYRIDRDGDSLEYHLPGVPRGKWVWILLVGWLILQLVGGVRAAMHGRWVPAVFPLVLILAMCLSMLPRLRVITVDPSGLKMPYRRRLPWSQVSGVVRPGRFDPVLSVQLVTGGSQSTGLPVELAEEVAEISGKPLVDKTAH